MATSSGASSQHATLTASTVDTVTLDADYDNAEVIARGTGDIYFTVGGVQSVPAAPTVGGAGTFVAPAGQALKVPVKAAGNTIVKLISSVAAAYSVTGV